MDGNVHVLELAQKALQANREHLHALDTYTRNLETELERFDKLLDALDTVDDSDLDLGYSVDIPGSVRAAAPVAAKELLSPESPFYDDASRRSRYQSVSEVRPMKTKELEALAEAVRTESHRKHALDIQKSGRRHPALLVTDVNLLGLDDEGIDWNRVAEKVSAISTTSRTARECEIRWLGEQHPELNHEPWSQEEVLKVKSLAAEFIDSRPDWITIAEMLGTKRTPLDCMRHATSRKSHQWTAEADKRLLKAIRMYGHENWHLVARYVSEDATPSQCSSRFQKTLDESIKHTAWTPEEDSRLSAAVVAYGSSWVDVAAHVPGRHNDQCRERWIEHLNPNINKGPWSEEEDGALIDYVHEHQDAPWKQISEHLRNGRTETMCRHRYAVLRRGAHTSSMAVSSEAQIPIDQEAESSRLASASSNTLCFKPSSLHPTPAVSHTECTPTPPNQFIFLEPVVNSNPESLKHHKPRASQRKTRFKTVTTDDILSSNTTTMPPSKKRKMQPHTRLSSSSIETQPGAAG